MFEDLFGTISPIFIATVITAFMQMVKAGYIELRNKELPNVVVQAITVLLNCAFGIPFHIFYSPEFTWILPLEGFLYSAALGLYSMGLYSVIHEGNKVVVRFRNGAA